MLQIDSEITNSTLSHQVIFITKTSLFKYTETITTKKKPKIFR